MGNGRAITLLHVIVRSRHSHRISPEQSAKVEEPTALMRRHGKVPSTNLRSLEAGKALFSRLWRAVSIAFNSVVIVRVNLSSLGLSRVRAT